MNSNYLMNKNQNQKKKKKKVILLIFLNQLAPPLHIEKHTRSLVLLVKNVLNISTNNCQKQFNDSIRSVRRRDTTERCALRIKRSAHITVTADTRRRVITKRIELVIVAFRVITTVRTRQYNMLRKKKNTTIK